MAAMLAGVLALGAAYPTHARVQSDPSTPRSFEDRGVFVLAVAGRTIGMEKFEIRATAGRVEARAEIALQVQQEGRTLDLKTFPTLVLDPHLNPLTYTWSQKGPLSSKLEVDFRASPARTRYKTVTGEEDQRDFDLPKDALVLDDNVVHHYQLVVDRYGLTPGGRQTFHAFIPQEALPGIINVDDAGTEEATAEGSATPLRHLVVTTELARIDLWVDDQQRLQRVAIPAAQFEAVRKK